MTTPGGYSAGTIFLQVVPSFRGFQEAVRRQAKAANRAFNSELGDGAGAEGAKAGSEFGRGLKTGAGRYVDDLKLQIRRALENLPKATIDADSRPADAQIDVLRARLAAIGETDLTIHANVERAKVQLQELRDELREIAVRNTDVDIVINAGRASLELDKIKFQLDELDRKKVSPDVDVHGLSDSGSAFRAFNGYLLAAVTIGPALIPILAGVSAGLGAIAVSGLGAGAGLGVAIVAFTGIAGAVKAMGQVAKTGAKDNLTAEKAIRNSARGIRDAMESLTQARENAATANEDASRRVQEANQSVIDAERNLAKAQRDAKRAQDDLTQARKDAADQAQKLADQAAGGALAERQGVIDVFNATVANNSAQADPGATNLEKEQASIALGEARLRLKEIREQNAATTKAQDDFKKKGVNGTDAVIAAQDRLDNAQQNVISAQEGVTKAVEGTRQAQEQQARTAVAGQRSIRDALERVADAQAAQAEAVKSASDIGSASAVNLANAMNQLSPAGQRFARFIYGLQQGFFDLRGDIQEAFLPAVQNGLQTLIREYGPAFHDFVVDMATVLGRLFDRATKALGNPMWQHFFDVFSRSAPVFTTLWAEIGGKVLTIIANLVAAFTPFATTFMQGFDDLLDGAVRWSAGLDKNKGFQRFLDYVSKYGPGVLDFFGSLVRAFVNLVRALAPFAGVVLHVLTGFLNFVANMKPSTLRLIAVGLVLLAAGIQLVLGAVALVSTILSAVTAFLGLAAVIDALGTAFIGLVLTIGAVIVIVIAVVAALVILYVKSRTFRNIVNAAFHDVGAAISWVWNKIIQPVLKAFWSTMKFLGDVVDSVVDLVIHLFGKLWQGISSGWHAFADTGAGKAIIGFWNDHLVPAIRTAVDEIKTLWDSLKEIFLAPIKFVVETVLNNGLIKAFNWIADKVGSKPIPRITVFDSKSVASTKSTRDIKLASGGVVPGYSPHARADNIPAWLTAGEFVLPVNAVRALRGQGGDDLLEALRQGQLPGYASGGLVGGLKRAASGALNLAGDLTGALTHPLEWLQKQVRKLYGSLNNSTIGKLLEGVPETLAKGAVDSIKSHLGFGGGGNSAVPAITSSRGVNAAIVKQLAAGYGWSTGETWDSLVALVNSESGFNNTAQNPTSTAYGMFQFLDSTWGPGGIAKTSDPTKQAIAGLEYIKGRYGNPTNAWSFHRANNWYAEGGEVEPRRPVLYDSGGVVTPGLTTVLNASRRPEALLTADQWDMVKSIATGKGSALPDIRSYHGATAAEIAEEIMFEKRVAERGGVYARST